MPKSISTPSNTQNAAINVPASFKAGDAVLCPSLGNSAFKLIINPNDKHKRLAIKLEGNYFYYDKKGYFVSANEQETDDFQPSLFHDTPANRQAVNALFGTGIAAPLVIDASKADDKEVVLLSALELSNIAFDIKHTAQTLDDIGRVLSLIYKDKVNEHTAKSLARLSHESANAWLEILRTANEVLNHTLAKTAFSMEGE